MAGCKYQCTPPNLRALLSARLLELRASSASEMPWNLTESNRAVFAW